MNYVVRGNLKGKWVTENEIEFIDYAVGEKKTILKAIRWLDRYLAAAKERDNWGEVDPIVAVKYAKKKIIEIRKWRV